MFIVVPYVSSQKGHGKRNHRMEEACGGEQQPDEEIWGVSCGAGEGSENSSQLHDWERKPRGPSEKAHCEKWNPTVYSSARQIGQKQSLNCFLSPEGNVFREISKLKWFHNISIECPAGVLWAAGSESSQCLSESLWWTHRYTTRARTAESAGNSQETAQTVEGQRTLTVLQSHLTIPTISIAFQKATNNSIKNMFIFSCCY